eukprot:scaffold419564_cov40-Prasinocladus_malaysianus.AAC.1
MSEVDCSDCEAKASPSSFVDNFASVSVAERDRASVMGASVATAADLRRTQKTGHNCITMDTMCQPACIVGMFVIGVGQHIVLRNKTEFIALSWILQLN